MARRHRESGPGTKHGRVACALWRPAHASGDAKFDLTLVFVGRVEVARISELRSVAETIRIERFTVDFDVAECWRHNRIACLGAGQAPAGLLALVAALESGVQASGIDFDKRAYKPHITLLRKADCRKEGVGIGAEIPDSATLPRRRASATDKKNPALEPVDWPARDFVLVKSSLRPDGARYEELGRWPLL